MKMFQWINHYLAKLFQAGVIFMKEIVKLLLLQHLVHPKLK